MREEAPNPAVMTRAGTGDEGLDRILKGGLYRGSLAIVQGPPGSGKTILAHQMAFHRIRHGESVLYVTMLSESHGRLHCHMQGMSFYRADALAQSLHYLNGYTTLRAEGPEGLFRLIVTQARHRKATLVVVDGLFVLDDFTATNDSFTRFINDLSMHAELTATTVLMLTNTRRSPDSPEYAMVDVWLELLRRTQAYRSVRELEVHKTRGSDFHAGRHLADITRHGLCVYPRLETVLGSTCPVEDMDAPVLGTGLPALDALVGGGIRGGSSTLALGPTGIGKTSLGLHFLHECTPARPGLVLAFYETPRGLIRKARARGIDLESLMDAGAVDFIWHPPTEQYLDAIAYQVFDQVSRRGTSRMLVDSVNALELTAVYPERLLRYLSVLVKELRVRACTSMFLHELPLDLGDGATPISGAISTIADNILLMRYVNDQAALRRTLTVMKMRESAFDPHIREFTIGPQGIRLGEPFAPPAAGGG